MEIRIPSTLTPEFAADLHGMRVTVLGSVRQARAEDRVHEVRVQIADVDATIQIRNPDDPSGFVSTRSASRGPDGWATPALARYLTSEGVDAYWFVTVLKETVRQQWPTAKARREANARAEYEMQLRLQSRRRTARRVAA